MESIKLECIEGGNQRMWVGTFSLDARPGRVFIYCSSISVLKFRLHSPGLRYAQVPIFKCSSIELVFSDEF